MASSISDAAATRTSTSACNKRRKLSIASRSEGSDMATIIPPESFFPMGTTLYFLAKWRGISAMISSERRIPVNSTISAPKYVALARVTSIGWRIPCLTKVSTTPSPLRPAISRAPSSCSWVTCPMSTSKSIKKSSFVATKFLLYTLQGETSHPFIGSIHTQALFCRNVTPLLRADYPKKRLTPRFFWKANWFFFQNASGFTDRSVSV